MRTAAIQMVSAASVEANLHAAGKLLEEAAAQGAELAVLPEYFWLLGLHDTDKLPFAETDGRGPLQDFLRRRAKDLGLWLAGGTIALATGNASRVSNTTLVFNPDGERVARYDKIHLFRFSNGNESYDESRVLDAGREPVAFDIASRDGNSYRVGLSICYDLRFPELYRALHADVLLVPSAFTFTTGQAHWEILLRARAIENFAYVVAAAQGGEHENGRRTWGHSMVVDPWGKVLSQRDEGAGVVVAELLKGELDTRRLLLPALTHRVL